MKTKSKFKTAQIAGSGLEHRPALRCIFLLTFGVWSLLSYLGRVRAQDPTLEAIGALAATAVVSIDAFLGVAADSLSEELYRDGEIIPDLQKIGGMIEASSKSVQAIPKSQLSDQDREYVEQLREVFALQGQQVTALASYARMRKKADLDAWRRAREACRPKIAALLGTDEPVTFENIKERLGTSLQKDYVHFSFQYPQTWKVDPKSGVNNESNFIRLELSAVESGETYTLETFSVGTLRFDREISLENEAEVLDQATNQFANQFSMSFPNFQIKRQGPNRLGKYRGYGMDFTSSVRRKIGDEIEIYGRVVLLPPAVTRQDKGVTVVMLATSLTEGIDSIADLGVKGDLPLIIASFQIAPIARAKIKAR